MNWLWCHNHLNGNSISKVKAIQNYWTNQSNSKVISTIRLHNSVAPKAYAWIGVKRCWRSAGAGIVCRCMEWWIKCSWKRRGWLCQRPAANFGLIFCVLCSRSHLHYSTGFAIFCEERQLDSSVPPLRFNEGFQEEYIDILLLWLLVFYRNIHNVSFGVSECACRPLALGGKFAHLWVPLQAVLFPALLST